MLLLLSPAKSLDFETPTAHLPSSQPLFVAQAAGLIEVLRGYAPQQVAELMSLSDKLAALNVARYQAWSTTFNFDNAKQAVLAFNGDVYEGLDAASLSGDDLAWAQEHVCILSGLYGVLRPLDLMQPYRLEMGTPLANVRGPNLYAYWGTQIADYLRSRLVTHAQPLVVNLASQEYFKAVDVPALGARVVDCVFEDYKGGKYKIISFHAKRARGPMARYCTVQRVQSVADLTGFADEGYAYDPLASTPDRLVFRRRVNT
jgi:hypothetical protein